MRESHKNIYFILQYIASFLVEAKNQSETVKRGHPIVPSSGWYESGSHPALTPTVHSKEYLLVIEGSVPPLRCPEEALTQPLSALSAASYNTCPSV